MNKTIAQKLDEEDKDSEEDFIAAGGIELPSNGSTDDPWYVFPDGSHVWKCQNCKRPFFDFGWGCCLPE